MEFECNSETNFTSRGQRLQIAHQNRFQILESRVLKLSHDRRSLRTLQPKEVSDMEDFCRTCLAASLRMRSRVWISKRELLIRSGLAYISTSGPGLSESTFQAT